MKTGKISEVKVPLQVILGEAEVSLEAIGSLGVGTIIELRSLAGEPVDLLAGGVRVARGEVVVIDENFGLRVTELCT
jgi:flagellar motor switch protein FliN/FliY